MKIAMTGGTGFIGRQFLAMYGDSFDIVVATGSGENRNAGRVSFVKTDYSEQSFSEIFQGCSAVVHLGARIPDSVTALDSIGNYLDNIRVTENLLRAVVNIGARNFIEASSVSVYDKSSGAPFTEKMLPGPDNSYGIAKAAAELMADMYSRKYGFAAKSLRIGQVLGYREYKNKGFYQMLQDDNYLGKSVKVFGTGKAARDYIYVKDVAYAIKCAIDHPDAAGVFNIGSGRPVTNLELARKYASVFENAGGVECVPVRNEDSRFWYMDISKAETELGFTPQYSTENMIKDIRIEMIKARGQTGDL